MPVPGIGCLANLQTSESYTSQDQSDSNFQDDLEYIAILQVVGDEDSKPHSAALAAPRLGVDFGIFKFNSPKKNSGISEQIKPLQLVGQAAEFKFESKRRSLS